MMPPLLNLKQEVIILKNDRSYAKKFMVALKCIFEVILFNIPELDIISGRIGVFLSNHFPSIYKIVKKVKQT